MRRKTGILFLIGLVFWMLPMRAQNWRQLGATIEGETKGDQLGWSVSLSANGDYMAIGAPNNDSGGRNAGHVLVYRWVEDKWSRMGEAIYGEMTGDQSGCSISLSSKGEYMAIGARLNDGGGRDAGHVRVYRWENDLWRQVGDDIDGQAVGDQFGHSVCISSDGNRLAVGAPFNDGSGKDSGHVRLFQLDNGRWAQMGNDIVGEMSGDQSGFSVSLDSKGNRIAIGAIFNKGSGVNSGHVRVFQWNSHNWYQMGDDIDGKVSGDLSGWSVSISAHGDRLAIGAPVFNSADDSGKVRVYQFKKKGWAHIGAEKTDRLWGRSVSLGMEGNLVAVGIPFNMGNNEILSSQVLAYQLKNDTWSQLKNSIGSEAKYDFSGHSVSLSADGGRMLIGAPYSDGNGEDSGQVRVFTIHD